MGMQPYCRTNRVQGGCPPLWGSVSRCNPASRNLYILTRYPPRQGIIFEAFSLDLIFFFIFTNCLIDSLDQSKGILCVLAIILHKLAPVLVNLFRSTVNCLFFFAFQIGESGLERAVRCSFGAESAVPQVFQQVLQFLLEFGSLPRRFQSRPRFSQSCFHSFNLITLVLFHNNLVDDSCEIALPGPAQLSNILDKLLHNLVISWINFCTT